MKRTIKRALMSLAGAAALMLALGLSACGDSGSSGETKSLYAQGMEIIQLMSEMTQSETYTTAYTDNEGVRAVVQAIADCDYTSPKAVYALSAADEDLEALVKLIDLGDASGDLKAFFTQRAFSSLMTQVNSRGGAEILAASSICSVEKTFVNGDVKENVIYLYTYDDAVPAAVTFLVGEDQAVSGRGTFVMCDAFDCDSEEGIKSFFSGILDVEVAEVSLEG